MKALKTYALLLLATALTTPPAEAAFCALRDPVETISQLFPQFTSHRSVIRVVGEEQRQAISDLLPPNTLHFSELGQHTLYVVFEDQTPLGFLHVRSEESEWGLVEVAWALTTDLKVIDFHLQRCRCSTKRMIEAPAFRNQLIGKNYLEMKALLSADGLGLNEKNISVSKRAKPLAAVVLRCALKTMLVTELAWAEEVSKYAALARAQSSFDQALTLKVVDQADLEASFPSVAKNFPGETAVMALKGSELFAVQNPAGETIGAVFRHPLMAEEASHTVEWHVDAKGKVIAIHSAKGWPDDTTKNAFESHVEQTFNGATSCSDRPTLLTKQATLMAQLAFQS